MKKELARGTENKVKLEMLVCECDDDGGGFEGVLFRFRG